MSELNNGSETNLQIVTKAKKSAVAYEKPFEKTSKKGRPRKKGAKIKLKELFDTQKEDFKEIIVELYGKKETVKYISFNLLWGQGLYQELRFVLVKYKNTTSILVSTNLDMKPESIIRLYSYRFKIEVTFRELKQLIGGLSYHFWCKSMPKLNRYTKKK